MTPSDYAANDGTSVPASAFGGRLLGWPEATPPRLRHTSTRRVLHGFASAVVYQALIAGNSIVLVPLFLRAWGPSTYGRWLSLTAVVGYLSLVDLGGQNFVGNLIAKAYVQGEDDEFRRLLSQGVSLFLVLAAGFLSLLILVVFVPPLLGLAPGHGLSLGDRLVMLFTGAAFLQSIPGGVFMTVYRATGRYARGLMVGNVLRAVSLCMLTGVLFLRLPPAAYAFSYMIALSSVTVATTLDARRIIPATRDIRVRLRLAREGRSHLTGSLLFWQMAVSTAVNQQGMVLILAATGSPVLVAAYVTHRTAAGVVSYLGVILLPVVWNELTFLDAAGQKEQLARLSILSMKLVILASGLTSLALWIVLPHLYPVWTGSFLGFDAVLVAIFLLQWLLFSAWNTAAWSLLATNRHRALAYWSSANAVLTLVVAYPAAVRWGVRGAAVATMSADIVCGMVTFPALAARRLGLRILQIYGVIFRTFAILAIPVALLAWIPEYARGWRWAILGVLGVGVAAYPLVRLTLTKDEWNWILRKRRPTQAASAA